MTTCKHGLFLAVLTAVAWDLPGVYAMPTLIDNSTVGIIDSSRVFRATTRILGTQLLTQSTLPARAPSTARNPAATTPSLRSTSERRFPLIRSSTMARDQRECDRLQSSLQQQLELQQPDRKRLLLQRFQHFDGDGVDAVHRSIRRVAGD